MGTPSIGIVLPRTPGRPQRPKGRSAAEWGRRVEALGYESLWTTEGWGDDSFLQLASVADATEELTVGTSVVNVYSRSPAVLAMAGTTLQRMSGGRAVLGVGTGHPGTVEDLHGMSFDHPVRRTHETVEIVKALAGDDESVEYDGELFSIGGHPGQGTDLPVYNAALGEGNRRLTGRLCDGWLPYNIPIQALDDAFETIAETARDVGRDPDEITVKPWVPALVGEDDARDELRGTIAWYVGAIRDDSYRNAIGESFPEKADRIAEAWRSGDRADAVRSVTDEMIDALAVVGPPGTARERLTAIVEETVIDTPIVSIPTGPDLDETVRTVEALSPSHDDW